MDLVFVDEQYGDGKCGQYTAISAAIFHEDVIHEYRNEFVLEYIKILGLEKECENTHSVQVQLPILHGSDCLPDYTDEQKLLVFKLVCRLIAKYNVRIIRVGYYNKSLNLMGSLDNAKRVSSCISGLEMYLKNKFLGNYAIVYELDATNLKKIQYNDMQNINKYAQIPDPDDNLSINVSSSVGKFFCEKENYCMYASDIAGWLLKKTSENSSAEFSTKVREVAKKIEDKVLYNKIIWMNGPVE